jgi:hypothetical protein
MRAGHIAISVSREEGREDTLRAFLPTRQDGRDSSANRSFANHETSFA